MWRIAFGLYMAYYYLRLLPYSVEMFSSDRNLPGADLVALNSYFPDALLNYDSSWVVQLILIFSVVFSLMIALGWKRRIGALCLWPLLMWMYNRNPSGDSPEYEYINWLVFILIFIPGGEAHGLDEEDPQWKFPPIYYWGGWLLLSLGYAIAGIAKYRSHNQNWFDGTAMYYILATDNARRGWYGNFFDHFPKEVFYPITWGSLYLEMFAPLCVLFRRTRLWWWCISTVVHFVILIFINIPQVSYGMILFHLFVFDENWLNGTRFMKKETLESTSASHS